MKIIWLMTLLLAFRAVSAPISELLKEFRKVYSLEAGLGYGRTPEQLSRRRRGTHLELTMAFKSILEREGYPCKLILGRIQLTDSQKAGWGLLDWEQLKPMLNPDEGELSFSWLQTEAPILPDMLTRNSVRSQYARHRIDLFPALGGFERASATVEERIIQLEPLSDEGIRAIEWGNGSPGKLAYYPYEQLREELFGLFSASEILGTKERFSHPLGIPGNAIRPQFTAVRILSCDYSGDKLPSEFVATLRITITAVQPEEAQALPCTVLTALIRQDEADRLSLEWRWEETGLPPENGDRVTGHPFQLILKNGEVVIATAGALESTGHYLLRITREVETFGWTDILRGALMPGANAQIILSPEQWPEEPIMALLTECEASRRLARLVIHHQDSSQLQGTLLTAIPLYEYADGIPERISAFVPVLSNLQSISRRDDRPKDSLLQSLMPMATAESLLSAHNPLSLLSALRSEDPNRASHIYLHKMPSTLLPEEYFCFARNDRLENNYPPQSLLQINVEYPRHYLALSSNGECVCLSQYTADSALLPNALFFPNGLEVTNADYSADYSAAAMLPAILAKKLLALDSALPAETQVLAEATLTALSCAIGESALQIPPLPIENHSSEPPALSLDSTALDGNEHIGEIEIIAQVSNLLPARIELMLNGTPYTEVLYPETPMALFTIAPQELIDGLNIISARAWNYANQPSEIAECRIVAPAVTSLQVTPSLVQSWNGTPDHITLNATMRNRHRWVATLSGNGAFVQQAGESDTVHATFDTTAYKDGDYIVTFSILNPDVSYAFPVAIDNVQGNPIARLDYPPAGCILREGVIAIQGTASATPEDFISYRITLQDEQGQEIPLMDGKLAEHFGLMAVPSSAPESIIERKSTPINAMELALLDLSSLPDGLYTLSLTVTASGSSVTESVSFTLASSLKTGMFGFTEEDFSLQAGNQPVKISRHYCSQERYDRGFGFGWSCNKEFLNPTIDETRAEIETLEDGMSCSVRTGGTRNVTVTLSNGQRCTFRFQLQAGGGYTFCYYALWEPPAGLHATLVPTCSNKLMTLTGLEPYWEAAGPSTPWELFDFPGFILTEADGTRSILTRELIAEGEILSDGTLPIASEDGEAIYIQSYGELKLSSQTLPSGHTFLFDDDSISSLLNGRREILLELEWDEAKQHILAATTYIPNGHQSEVECRMEYHYQDGNLIQVRRGHHGLEATPIRSYEYAHPAFPHHVTAIRNGDGALLMGAQYDNLGRMTACTNANGESSSLKSNAFAGYETRTDALGRESTLFFDAYGSIVEELAPNGAKIQYSYDENHREIAMTDAYGNTVHKLYDTLGNLARITRPDGSSAEYLYEGDKCVQATEFCGNTSHFLYDSRGCLATFQAPNGNLYHADRDDAGNLTALSLNGTLLSQCSYDATGRLTSVTDFATGTQYSFRHDLYGNTIQTEFTLFEPTSGEETTFTSQSEYSSDNRLISTSLSNGYWERFQYDSNGNLSRREDCNGAWLAILYDASGEVVQMRDENGLVIRYGRDGAGQVSFIAGPEKADGETHIFQRAVCYEYDLAGCPVKTTEVKNAKVSLVSTGTGFWKARILEYESPRTTQRSYDLKGRLTSTQSQEGFTSQFGYDANDRMTSRSDHYGNQTAFEYNRAGLLTRIRFSDQACILYEYDNCGHLTSVTNQLGNKREYRYSNDGQMLSNILPDETTIHYDYTPHGVLSAVTLPTVKGDSSFLYEYDSVLALSAIEMPSGKRITFANNEFGRRISTTLPMGQRSTSSYETPGLLPIQQTDFAGNITQFEYDINGRVVSKSIFPHGAEVPEKRYIYRYHPSGWLSSATLQLHTETDSAIFCEYDSQNRMTRYSNGEIAIHSRYDADGNLMGLEWGDTHLRMEKSKETPIITTTYRIAAGEEATYSTAHDTRGRPARITRPNGSTRSITYDLAGNLTAITECNGNNQEVYRFSCMRDSCGRIIAVQENHAGEQICKEYAYDEWGQLTLETRNSNHEAEESYYNEDGILAKRVMKHGSQSSECQYHHDDNGRLLRIKSESSIWLLDWDDNGSLLSIRECANDNSLISSQSFLWDAEGMLRQTAITTPARTLTVLYDYDANSLLCGETCLESTAGGNRLLYRHDYLFYAADSLGIPVLLQTITRDSDGNARHRQTYIWENGLTGFFRDGTLYSCICDGGGSVIGALDEKGEWAFWRDYTAWGVPCYRVEEPMEPHLAYRGELYSPATGLLYLRSRFYLPSLGIFISADRHEPDLMQPLELNRHSYCRNDPINRCDPLGGFSLISMPLATSLSLGMALRLGICAELAIETIYSACLSQEMALDFEAASRSSGNATVIVHGVWKHEPNYAEDFVTRLQHYASNQDYYQFRWSGFGGLLPMGIPNSIQHSIAQHSLEFCLGSLKAKGYAHINLIGHSWGTVLSKDALNTGVIDVGLWSTMGSPLAIENPFAEGAVSFPRFNYEKWMNIYNLCDPVVYLCMNSPLISLRGPNLDSTPLSPLFESPLPEQYNLGFIAPDVHGCYWYNPTAILAITLFTRNQR